MQAWSLLLVHAMRCEGLQAPSTPPGTPRAENSTGHGPQRQKKGCRVGDGTWNDAGVGPRAAHPWCRE